METLGCFGNGFFGIFGKFGVFSGAEYIAFRPFNGALSLDSRPMDAKVWGGLVRMGKVYNSFTRICHFSALGTFGKVNQASIFFFNIPLEGAGINLEGQSYNLFL